MKKDRITSIDLWSFIFIIAIGVVNLNNIIWKSTNERLLFTGGKVLVFFFILAGYFLMKHYKENKKKASALEAWKYTGSRFSRLYPAMLGGITLAFIVRNAIFKTNITNIFSVFLDSMWEFIGLSTVGSNSATFLWNEPLWYISAILFSGLILYSIVSKSEDFFAGIFAPLIILATYSFMPQGLLLVMATMSAGMLLYYIVEYVKNKKLTEVQLLGISFAHIGLIMLFIYYGYKGMPWNDATTDLMLFAFCGILLINKDYIAVLYNKSAICAFLGKLSLYYYAYHIVFIYLLSWLFPKMGYMPNIAFNVLFSTCWAFIMMYVDDYVITPIFRTKKKEEVKKMVSKKRKKLDV